MTFIIEGQIENNFILTVHVVSVKTTQFSFVAKIPQLHSNKTFFLQNQIVGQIWSPEYTTHRVLYSSHHT